MAQTPEGRVKRQIVKVLQEIGAFYFFPVAGPFGRSGIPDIICCIHGIFVGIECKANGNQPTALQAKALADIERKGGVAIVCTDENVHAVADQLKMLDYHLKDLKWPTQPK